MLGFREFQLVGWLVGWFDEGVGVVAGVRGRARVWCDIVELFSGRVHGCAL